MFANPSFEFDRACAEIAVAPDCCPRPFRGRSSCNRLSPALEAVDQGFCPRVETRAYPILIFNISIFAKILAKVLTFARHFSKASHEEHDCQKIARKSYNFCERCRGVREQSMPIEFLTDAQRRGYGRFNGSQLQVCWHATFTWMMPI